MFSVLLTNLRNFLTFWQYHENMAFLASMYFIRYIQAGKAGRWCFRRSFLTFLPDQYTAAEYWKLFSFLPVNKKTPISQISRYGSRDFISKSPARKKCLTVDTRDVNELGPGKFRTSADNGQEQVCYFNKNKSDTHFTSYTSKRISSETLLFSIVKVNCFLLLKSIQTLI